MVIIEFFGLPNTGKTTFKINLTKNYFKSFKIFDYKSIVYSEKNLIYRIYFNIIKNKKIKKIKNLIYKKKINFNLLFKKHNQDINQKIFNKKLDKKIFKIKKFIDQCKFENNNKETFWRWAKEEMLANEIALKRKKNNKEILIDSEGLIQRLFIYCYKKKNKRKIINDYLSLINLPKILIFFNKKYLIKNKFNLNYDELNNIYLKVLDVLKSKKIYLLDGGEDILTIRKKIKKICKI